METRTYDGAEFPFVAELPRREKSRWAQVWEDFKAMQAVTQEHGVLVPVGYVVKLLAVSRQRVYELCDVGRLQAFEFNGHYFVTQASIEGFCRSERKGGRPVKAPGLVECLKVGKEGSRPRKEKP
jgi:hypothetical protein